MSVLPTGVSLSRRTTVNTVGSLVDAENAVNPAVVMGPLICWIFADSDVFAVPGVLLLALVLRTNSTRIDGLVAVTPSIDSVKPTRSPGKVDGVMIISTVLAVLAVSAKSALVPTSYADLGMGSHSVQVKDQRAGRNGDLALRRENLRDNSLPVHGAVAQCGDIHRRATGRQRHLERVRRRGN